MDYNLGFTHCFVAAEDIHKGDLCVLNDAEYFRVHVSVVKEGHTNNCVGRALNDARVSEFVRFNSYGYLPDMRYLGVK